MMAGSHEGKFMLIYLLVGFALLNASCVFGDLGSRSEPVAFKNEELDEHKAKGPDALNVFNRQQHQLEKLEELVKNLSELVSKLESRFLDYPESKNFDNGKQSREGVSALSVHSKGDFAETRNIGDNYAWKFVTEDSDSDGRRKETSGAISVTKYSHFWSERFQFVSAVRLGSVATSIIMLPFKDFEGWAKYFAVGDDQGNVYVFSRNGDVLTDFHTLSDSSITAMVSYLSINKNESIVVTAHADGVILAHKVWEVSNGEEWGSLLIEHLWNFAPPDAVDGRSSITILDVHHVGRNRYILAVDLSGKLRVFRENGTVYGLTIPASRPLSFLKQRLLFLTETGAGSLDLRTMRIRESECEGLNSSLVKKYVFDATERSKAYGYTSDGDIIHVLLLGDIMNFKCRVRSKKKVDMEEPLALQAIKGYLLIANLEKVWIYNVSSQHYVRAGGPRLMFSAGLDEILASFVNNQPVDTNDKKKTMTPLIASDRDKLVILSLGSGYVGMYKANLPIYKNEFNTMLWTTPVLFFILFLFAAWHFFANKKEALTSWGPDDPFSSASVTSAAPVGSGSSARPFTDSSRNSDLLDLRGGGLRGPSGRYVSPSQYSGGSSNPYRAGSSETNSRPASVDPSFRSSELKYRGSGLETSGFPKRREGLFVNSPIVDDST